MSSCLKCYCSTVVVAAAAAASLLYAFSLKKKKGKKILLPPAVNIHYTGSVKNTNLFESFLLSEFELSFLPPSSLKVFIVICSGLRAYLSKLL